MTTNYDNGPVEEVASPTVTVELPSPPAQIETVADLRQLLLSMGKNKAKVDALPLDEILQKLHSLQVDRFPGEPPDNKKTRKKIAELLDPLFEGKKRVVTTEGSAATRLIGSILGVMTSGNWKTESGGKAPQIAAGEQHYRG